jgi:hypothetical protein
MRVSSAPRWGSGGASAFRAEFVSIFSGNYKCNYGNKYNLKNQKP